MVLLTIIAPSNDYTVYFHRPLTISNYIKQPNYIRLLSCSLYNSWFNFKGGTVTLIDKEQNYREFETNLQPGFYTIETFVEALKKALQIYENINFTDADTPAGMLILQNSKFGRVGINFSEEFDKLFNIEETLSGFIFNKKHSLSTYFIHCDLVDMEKNLLNGKRSSILARFDVKGKPYEKISYNFDPNVLRDTSSGQYVNGVTVSVRDELGELLNFNGFPLEFELEIR